MKKLKLFSFFSGSGFLDLGFETAGYDIQLVNEYSKSFIKAYQYSRELMEIKKPCFGYQNIDINEFLFNRADELKEYISLSRKDGSLVGFIGGPPCPDFSVAGKQKGRDGDNGKLSQSYIDLIVQQQPDFFLFENVKGLWRTAKHRAYFEELKAKLSENGYYMVNRLTNALEFGAPQDRDRIFLFGVSKRIIKNQEYLDNNFCWEKFMKYSMDEIRSIEWSGQDPFVKDSITVCPESIPKELTVQHWFEKNDVYNHPNSNDFFVPRQGLARMQTVLEGDDSKKSYKRIHRWRYSPTVAYGNNEVHLHPYKERRLSVAEALALQSLPKEFCLPTDMTLTDKFKTIGNGVPFVMAKGLADTIKDFFESGDF